MNALKKLNILTLVLFVCALAACDGENQKTNQTTIAAKTKTATPVKTKAPAPVKAKTATPVKTKAPYQKKETYFSLPNRTGGKVDLASYANKPVMIFFFAEYCHYCKKAAPFIKKIHSAYSNKGITVLGISVDENKANADNFTRDYNLTFPIAYRGGALSAQYKTRGVPYIFMLDKKHEIMNVWAGYDKSYDDKIIETVNKAIKRQS